MGTPYRILVIDDDPILLETAAELLESEGYVVLRAGAGREGIAVARAEHPHLILLDFDMPEMGGLAVMRALKAEPSTAGIPTVALTAGTAVAGNKLVHAGCVGYIPKPFNNPEFARLVAGLIKATVGRFSHDPSRLTLPKGGARE